jgi:hypothetical protein
LKPLVGKVALTRTLTVAIQDIAQFIKKEVSHIVLRLLLCIDMTQFDSRKGATWHCIVGRNFGSFVTHGSYPTSNVKEYEH